MPLTKQVMSRQLLDGAAAVFARRGEKASMQEVADAVGLSKAGLQHHFPSKETLHDAVQRETTLVGENVRQRVADMRVGPERDLRAIEAWVDTALAHPGFVALLLMPVTDGSPTDDLVQDSGLSALAAFGVDPATSSVDRTIRVSAALAALAVLALTAAQRDLALSWRSSMVAACYDALGHPRLTTDSPVTNPRSEP